MTFACDCVVCLQVYRSYIALGQYDVVQSEINDKAPTALQAVKALSTYMQNKVRICVGTCVHEQERERRERDGERQEQRQEEKERERISVSFVIFMAESSSP